MALTGEPVAIVRELRSSDLISDVIRRVERRSGRDPGATALLLEDRRIDEGSTLRKSGIRDHVTVGVVFFDPYRPIVDWGTRFSDLDIRRLHQIDKLIGLDGGLELNIDCKICYPNWHWLDPRGVRKIGVRS